MLSYNLSKLVLSKLPARYGIGHQQSICQNRPSSDAHTCPAQPQQESYWNPTAESRTKILTDYVT